MDPNAILAELRSLIMQYAQRADDAGRLAQKVALLDTHLTNGGALPDDWARCALVQVHNTSMVELHRDRGPDDHCACYNDKYRTQERARRGITKGGPRMKE